MRYLPFLVVIMSATAAGQPRGNSAPGQAVDVDTESGAEVYLLGGDERPTLVSEGKRFGHVSVSRDGKCWIGDTGEQGIPIYIGGFAAGRVLRACFSRTEYDEQPWSHTHPYLTADNQWLIFGARRNGHPQVYGAKLKGSASTPDAVSAGG